MTEKGANFLCISEEIYQCKITTKVSKYQVKISWFQGCFTNSSSLFNLDITSSMLFLFIWSHKKAQIIPILFTPPFFRGILYIQSIKASYSFKHILFTQGGVVAKTVHHFCHYICGSCFPDCQTQDVICVFSDERQIVPGFSCR